MTRIKKINRTEDYNERLVLTALKHAKEDGFGGGIHTADIRDYISCETSPAEPILEGKKLWPVLDRLVDFGELSLEKNSDTVYYYSITPLGELRIENSECGYLRLLESNYIFEKIKNDELIAKQKKKGEPLDLLAPIKLKAFDSYGEKREALIIPPQITKDSLKKDVARGAYPFKKLLSAYKNVDFESNVCFLRSPSLELGYKAITYLAAIDNVRDGIQEEFLEDPDLFSLSDFDPFEHSVENVLPIVVAGDMVRNSGNTCFGMGDVSMAGLSSISTKPPYWLDTSVIIILNSSNGFYLGPDFLSDALDRVVGNKRRIYVLTVERDLQDNDDEDDMPESASFLLNLVKYNATNYDVVCSSPYAYDVKVFDGLAARIGLSVAGDFEKQTFLEKLAIIMPENKSVFLEQLFMREWCRGNRIITPQLMTLLGRIESGNSNRLKGWDLLNSLDGIDSTIEQIKDLINHAKLNKARKAKGKGLNSVATPAIAFVGDPGTAKTTVGQGLCDIMCSEGLLPGNRFTCVTGASLMGQFVGTSAGKTRQIIESADAILIDEAYSLTESRSPYAYECLGELCSILNEIGESGSKLIIFAGYPALMDDFFDQNPGIRSRVSNIIQFDSYDAPSMARIFMKQCSNAGYTFSEKDAKVLKKEVEAFFAERIGSESFGNGREARNLLLAAMKEHSHVMEGIPMDEVKEEDLTTLSLEDVRRGMEKLKEMNRSCSNKTHKISLIG